MLQSPPFEVTLADKQSVLIPVAVLKPFIEQNHKRVKVVATLDAKRTEFYAALKREKSGQYRIYFSKAKQKALAVFMNDYFSLQLFEDRSKYGVDISEELEAVLLSDYKAYTIFEGLTAGKKRSIIYAISRYKATQTRVDKAITLTNNLKRGVTDPKLWLKNT